MVRVSTDTFNNDMQFSLRQRELSLNDQENKMAAQTRILIPRDDPAGAANATRLMSYQTRLEQYSKNISYAMDKQNVAEGYMKEAVDIMQRVREIAVQGANGTYTKDDLRSMGQEVNQLLNELVQIGNAKNGDGTYVFSGLQSRSQAFRTISGNVPGADEQFVTGVQYIGDIGRNKTDVSDVSTVATNFPGNSVFWAEHQQIFSSRDATSYTVQKDSTVYIDNQPVQLTAGDNIYAIIHKINDSAASVKARLDPISNGLVIESTSPHQIWLQDGPASSVLQDLGVISSNADSPPQNISQDARVYGGSLFDMVVHLRDSLYSGNGLDVGGSALQGIDSGLHNLLGSLGQLGAQHERLQMTLDRTTNQIPEVAGEVSRETDLNVTKAITDLKMLQYSQQAALQTAARVLPPTLLDFLR